MPKFDWLDNDWRASPLLLQRSGATQALERSTCLFGGEISDRPTYLGDALYWQFPARTEASAADAHSRPSRTQELGTATNVYVAYPWATYIDMHRKCAWTESGLRRCESALRRISIKVAYLRHTHAAANRDLRVHTVCQHIFWQDLAQQWADLGITDAWLSHCPRDAQEPSGMQLRLHAWPLYAVNVEDPTRRVGLDIGTPVSERRWLASFSGAYMAHYLDKTRLHLAELPLRPDCSVRITGEWHFEAEVYRRQIEGQADHPLPAVETIKSYNQLISRSIFSLCPAGAGENTLRLWESLAAGAIPVVFGQGPSLPTEGAAKGIDWDRILVRVSKADIPSLYTLLEAVSVHERSERQRLGMQAYASVRQLRCF